MKKMTKDARKKRGKRGEDLAAAFLLAQGYEIVARNWRLPEGELDIVAQKGGCLYFVEVRSKRGVAFGAPQESVTAVKRRQVAKMAGLYLAANGQERDCAFMLAAVFSDSGRVELIEDFF
ncbi:MAG: YraN family protein [Clostridiales bacterium]|nr:YraN family protein [Clostridiales bacterium]